MNNTEQVKKGRKSCEICGASRPSTDEGPSPQRRRLDEQSAPAAAAVNDAAGAVGQATVEGGEAGVLSLAGLFGRLFGGHVRELFNYWRDKLRSERALVSAEFRGIEKRFAEQKAELERLANEVCVY